MVLTQSEEQLVASAAAGDNEAMESLFATYEGLMQYLARRYFIPGATLDDLVQEARIGLFKAVRDFRPDAGSTFKSFAALAVQRQLITALKTAKRKKHEVHNQATSLDQPVGDDDGPTSFVDRIAQDADKTDPVAVAISAALRQSIIDAVMGSKLSDFEATVLLLRLQDMSYEQMALSIGKPVKSVDNALQRLNQKLRRALAERLRDFVAA
jgi:RNA polymerase sporulation-specific sigma factor